VGVDNQSDALSRLQHELDDAKRQLRRKDVELRAVLAQSEEISYTDALTYLPNRRKIVSSLQHEVLRANRYQTSLSVSMMDIDHFKEINDSHGHGKGDEVLRALANTLRQGIRESDLAGRLGGEEFLILLPNAGINAAAEQAERLCRLIRELVVRADDVALRITVSIGVAEYRLGAETWDDLLRRVDAAMYEAKNLGRDRWAIASS